MTPAENTRVWRKARREAWKGTLRPRRIAPAPAVLVTVTDECQEPAAIPVPAELAAEIWRLARLGRAAALVTVTTHSRPDDRPLRAACPCPDHPGRDLLPMGGGAARGLCPADGRSYQLDTPEVA